MGDQNAHSLAVRISTTGARAAEAAWMAAKPCRVAKVDRCKFMRTIGGTPLSSSARMVSTLPSRMAHTFSMVISARHTERMVVSDCAPRTTQLRIAKVTGSASSTVLALAGITGAEVDPEVSIATGPVGIPGIGITLVAELEGISVGEIDCDEEGINEEEGIKAVAPAPLEPLLLAAVDRAVASLIKTQLPTSDSREASMVITQSSKSSLPPARMAKMA